MSTFYQQSYQRKCQRRGVGKVSVQGVVAHGGHFATLCQKLDFYEAKKEKISLIIFEKKRQILLHF